MIPFTQYLRPDGRFTAVHIDRPQDIEAKAAEVVAAGGRFEAEVLNTGVVSFEVVAGDSDDPFSVAIELCENGPAVLDAVDQLVRDAYSRITDGVFVDGSDECDADPECDTRDLEAPP